MTLLITHVKKHKYNM